MSYLKIEYWNSVDLGDVLFQTGWKGKIYLDVEVERPDYNTTIESDVNGENKEIPKFKKLEKVYKFECPMQEDLVDAFKFIQLCDNIEITLQTGETVVVDQLRAEHEWQEAGCLANVTVNFTEDYIIGGTCTENMNAGCICDVIAGSFAYIDVPGAYANPQGTIALLYTSAPIPGARYVAKLFEASATYTWLELPSALPGDCYTNDDDSTQWYYDATYWQLLPGFIISSSYAAPNQSFIGWAPEGLFVTLWLDLGLGYVDYGDFASQDLETGITVNVGVSGSHHAKLEVWNHSCDLGFTEVYDFVIP